MLNKHMKKQYYILYITRHKNGKYYGGRHITYNLDDGYLGSGIWIRDIKDKSELTREIEYFATEFNDLVNAENMWLVENYGKENCMNFSNASTGWGTGNSNPMKNPEIAEKISGDNHYMRTRPEARENSRKKQNTLVENGTHNLLGDRNPNKDGSVSRRTAELGRNIFQTNNPSTWRSEQGIHHWQNGNAPNANGELNKKLVAEGRHNFQGPDLNNKRIAEGTHNFVGSDSNLKRLAEGRHPSQMKKTCEHCGKIASISMYTRWHGSNCRSIS